MKKKNRLLFFGILVMVGSIAFYSVIIEPNMILVSKPEVCDEALSMILQDKIVLQLSDLHIRRFGFREKLLIKKINELIPDLIFITGDFIGGIPYKDGFEEQAHATAKILNHLKARHGIWCVLGEEDLIPDDKHRELLAAFEDTKINLLLDEKVDVKIDNDRLSLVGIGTNTGGIRDLFFRIGLDNPAILLSHYTGIVAQAADALTVNLEDSFGKGVKGWAWQDNAFWTGESGDVYFEKDGLHTIRVQRREDGVNLSQIILTPSEFEPAGAKYAVRKDVAGDEPSEDIVIDVNDINDEDIHGAWQKTRDNNSEGGMRIMDYPDTGHKISIPMQKPVHYFDAHFEAKAGVRYHLWIWMKANRDRLSSDSVYVQFNDSVDEYGIPIYRMEKPLIPVSKFNLIVAGDSHGGQVRVPFLGPLLNIFGERIHYDQGLFNVGGTQLYVNRGIGWSTFPVRFLCPPEITQFSFRRP